MPVPPELNVGRADQYADAMEKSFPIYSTASTS